jgi:putative endonuclease
LANSTERAAPERKPKSNNDRQLLGAAGEDRVIAKYLADGYRLLDRNWHDGRSGELDLVFTKRLETHHVVAVCEVKTRRTDTFGDGLEAVTVTKQRRLRRLAAAWLTSRRDLVGAVTNEPIELRIDVAAVRLGRGPAVIEIVEGAC